MIETDRLILRPWRDTDIDSLAALNADPEVMAFIGEPRTRAQTETMVDTVRRHATDHGFGLWAIEVKAGAGREPSGCIGFAGLNVPTFEAPFMPCVEAVWRLARRYWGAGYATEAARAAVADGFDRFGFDEIVAFTAVGNARSRAVMARLGMDRDAAADFDHPALPVGHPLRRHALYRLRRPGRVVAS